MTPAQIMLLDILLEKIITVSATMAKVKAMQDEEVRKLIDENIEPRRRAAVAKALGEDIKEDTK